ncbi:MAG: VacJ family lipoprotein [Sphingomonadales bacterium]
MTHSNSPGPCGSRLRAIFLLVLVTFVFGACATAPPRSDVDAYNYYKEVNDPIEPMNRVTLKFNRGLEKVIIKPVTKVYRFIIPRPLRKGISNALFNLETPVILLNDLLQGEEKRAWHTLKRFAINSTVGLGGLIDVAAKGGTPRHDEDFGQTLAVHGVGEGPYIVLPFFGPSNPRDTVGLIADIFSDPLFWIFRAKNLDTLKYTRFGLDIVDTYDRHMEDIEELERGSLDYYAALRSAFRQNRASEIRNGRAIPLEELEDDIFDELDKELEEEGGEGDKVSLDSNQKPT